MSTLLLLALTAGCTGDGGGLTWRKASASGPAPRLRIVAPDLTTPLAENGANTTQPRDPVKRIVFERINRDRTDQGLSPVQWDEATSRVADAFCAQQVKERSRGHFLMDGVPPYARTAFAGVFGMQSENAVFWTTSGLEIRERLENLAVLGHERMMEEKPPNDGHRKTILDPEATHVGVGYAAGGSRFHMAQEFMTRRLERLQLSRVGGSRPILRVEGQTLAPERLQFVTVAIEPPPRALTREQSGARSSYGYPRASFAYVPEGRRGVEVVGLGTRDTIRMRRNREFSFHVTADSPGLWTILFFTSSKDRREPSPGGLAVIWVEAEAPAAEAAR